MSDSFATLCAVDSQAPLYMGFQVKILEWVDIYFSRESSLQRNRTRLLTWQVDSLPLRHQRSPTCGIKSVVIWIWTNTLNWQFCCWLGTTWKLLSVLKENVYIDIIYSYKKIKSTNGLLIRKLIHSVWQIHMMNRIQQWYWMNSSCTF